jgi:hypothetical protein
MIRAVEDQVVMGGDDVHVCIVRNYTLENSKDDRGGGMAGGFLL